MGSVRAESSFIIKRFWYRNQATESSAAKKNPFSYFTPTGTFRPPASLLQLGDNNRPFDISLEKDRDVRHLTPANSHSLQNFTRRHCRFPILNPNAWVFMPAV